MAEPMFRRCNKCSLQSPTQPGQPQVYHLTVRLGEGNCEDCQAIGKAPVIVGSGSKDDAFGKEGGDHDVPYRWGRLPTVDRLGSWSYMQYSRLVALKARYSNRFLEAKQDGI